MWPGGGGWEQAEDVLEEVAFQLGGSCRKIDMSRCQGRKSISLR